MRRRKRSKKWLYWLLVVVLLVVAVVVGYRVWEEYFRNDDTVLEDDTREGDKNNEVKIEGSGKGEEEVEEQESSEPENPKVKPQYEGNNPNTGGELTGAVTYAGVNDGKLMIRVNIDQYLAGGSCTLSLLKDGVVFYDESVDIINSAATATCEGFDISTEYFNKSGKIDIIILLESDEKTGKIEGKVNL